MSNFPPKFLGWLILLLAPAMLLGAQVETPLMKLAEVRPGMKGEWKTVVSGTQIQSFPLEVLGVMQNFAGPQRAVIICHALGADQILNGPVAGMSGSPVYIDGKLVGAYAYGFALQREQTLIGVTPIEQMLELLDLPEGEPNRFRPKPSVAVKDTGFPLRENAAEGWRVTAGAVPDGVGDALLKPLPTPLMVSGVSARTLAAFRDEFSKLGLEPMQAPTGAGSSPTAAGLDGGALEPGAPVAAVLLDGDFSLCGVGTVTWREGNRLLAFGHPMFQAGSTATPMATAEVVTIVRSLRQSFKLANIGRTVGTIYQDRLTAIAGEVGRAAPFTAFSITVDSPETKPRTYAGHMLQDRSISPLLGAVALLESLTSSMEAGDEQTLFTTLRVELEGHEPVVLRDVASGANAPIKVAMRHLRLLSDILQNPFEFPKLKAIRYEVKVRNAWATSRLEGVQVLNGPLESGEPMRVALTVGNLLAPSVRHTVEVPIPPAAELDEYTLFVGDAEAADQLDRGRSRRDFQALDDVLNFVRQGRTSQRIYVRLLQRSQGLRVEGASLFDLPPSVRALYTSPKTVTPRERIDQRVVWQTEIEVPGEFSGQHTLPVTTR